MQNTPGKEMDLLRVTVKVPGKRPPRAVPACGPPPGLNGLVKDVQSPEGTSSGEEGQGMASVSQSILFKYHSV